GRAGAVPAQPVAVRPGVGLGVLLPGAEVLPAAAAFAAPGVVSVAGVHLSGPGSGRIIQTNTLPASQRFVLRAGPTHDGRTPEEARVKQIAGYEILGVLGRGGFGETYKARQPGTGRLVLIELAPLPRDAGPEERGRFRVRTLERARLRHPNVVQLLDV